MLGYVWFTVGSWMVQFIICSCYNAHKNSQVTIFTIAISEALESFMCVYKGGMREVGKETRKKEMYN